MDWHQFQNDHHQNRAINSEWATPNNYRTYELNAGELQSDVDWYNHHFELLNVVPKFTKGQVHHPYHPKRYIHDLIDKVIRTKREQPGRFCTIKVSVDCIDDSDFCYPFDFRERAGRMGAMYRRLAQDDAYQQP